MSSVKPIIVACFLSLIFLLPATTYAAIQGEYYNWTGTTPPASAFVTANRVNTRVDADINFEWGTGAPGPAGVGADLFAVRWRGQVNIPTAGTWTFYANTDDGARLYVDGALNIDVWVDRGPPGVPGSPGTALSLAAGYHNIVFEYYENGGGATAQLYWSGPGVAAQPIPAANLALPLHGLHASYYNANYTTEAQFLASTPDVTRNDATVDFAWADLTVTPQNGVNGENFSVHWSGEIQATGTGAFTFYVSSDDGEDLFVNGTQLITNLPTPQPVTESSGTISLVSGQRYSIDLFYQQGVGGDECHMSWNGPGTGGKVIIPESVLYDTQPSDIAVSAYSVAETSPINTVVGTLSTTVPDSSTLAQRFTYSLVSGTGSTDNASFNISGTSLRTSASLNYEVQSSYSIRVRTTYSGTNPNNLYFEKAVTINVTNVNEAPTNIVPSDTNVDENAGPNAVVCTLSTTDPDNPGAGQTFVYTIVGGTDGALFNINANLLRLNGSVDSRTHPTLQVTVRSTDQGAPQTPPNLFIDKTFTITVNDKTPPNVTAIAPTTPSPTNSMTVIFSVTFDEAVQNFNDGLDVVITESGVSHTGMNIAGGPSVYTVNLTGVSGDGTVTVAVSMSSDVTDLTGNRLASSMTSAAVTIDNTRPSPPIVTGTTPTNDRTPTWTWTPGGGGNGTYRWQLDSSGTWAEITAAAYTPVTDLSEGSHRLVVQERDAAGNWSMDSFFDIFVDLTPPTPPNVTGTTPTNDRTPTWTWTPGGGGNGTYRWQFDSSGTWTETTDTAYTPVTDLSEGSHRLVVQERDDVGNWSVDGFFDIVVDLTPPSPPIVTGLPATKNPRPTWTWTPGAGANGTYRWQLDSSGTWTEITATAYTPGADLNEGSHRLTVEERDAAGNWSGDSFFNIFVDLTPPTVTVTPQTTSSQTPLISGEAHDNRGVASVSIVVGGQSYTANRVGGTWTAQVTNPLPAGIYDVVAHATDTAGNTANDTTTNELTISLTAPSVTVDHLLTNDPTPTLTGTATAQVAHTIEVVHVVVNGATYTYTPAPPANTVNWSVTTAALADGTYDVQAEAMDELSRPGGDGSTNELTVDTQAPTAILSRATAGPTHADSVAFIVAFDEPVTPTFDASDITLTGNLAGTVAVDGTDPNYTVTVTLAAPDADGTVGISVGTGVTDLAGNPYAGDSSLMYTVDNTAPTASITLDDPTPTGAGVVHFSVDFNEPLIMPLTPTDVSLTPGSLAGSIAVSDTDPHYTVTVTLSNPDAEGTLGITIPAEAVSDLAGNPYGGNASPLYTILHVTLPVAGVACAAVLLGLISIGGVKKMRKR